MAAKPVVLVVNGFHGAKSELVKPARAAGDDSKGYGARSASFGRQRPTGDVGRHPGNLNLRAGGLTPAAPLQNWPLRDCAVRRYAQVIDLLAEAKKLGPNDPGVAAATGGVYSVLAEHGRSGEERKEQLVPDAQPALFCPGLCRYLAAHPRDPLHARLPCYSTHDRTRSPGPVIWLAVDS